MFFDRIPSMSTKLWIWNIARIDNMTHAPAMISTDRLYSLRQENHRRITMVKRSAHFRLLYMPSEGKLCSVAPIHESQHFKIVSTREVRSTSGIANVLTGIYTQVMYSFLTRFHSLLEFTCQSDNNNNNNLPLAVAQLDRVIFQ